MAELKSLGTIFPNLLVDDGGGLPTVVPTLVPWLDEVFPLTIPNAAAALAWRDKYGSLVDRLCEADGSSVKISEQSGASIQAVMAGARLVLNLNTDAQKTTFHGTLTSANPFRDSKSKDATYERLLAVVSSMYFAVEKKTSK